MHRYSYVQKSSLKTRVFRALGAVGVAAGLLVQPAAAEVWNTVVVAPSDNMSGLFRAHNAKQGDLAALISNETAARMLRAIKPGDVVEMRVSAAGKLDSFSLSTASHELVALRSGIDNWSVRSSALSKRAKQAMALRKLELAFVKRAANAAAPHEDGSQATAVTEYEFRVRAKPLAQEKQIAVVTDDRPAAEPLEGPTSTPAIQAVEPLPVFDGVLSKRKLAKSVRQAELKLSRIESDVAGQLVWALESDQPLIPNKLIFAPSLPARTVVADASPVDFHKVLLKAERRQNAKVLAFSVRSNPLNDPRILAMLKGARSHIGVPYLWGGNTPNGFDCSGFVVYHTKRIGVALPRTAHQQFVSTRSSPVGRGDLEPGDLVFFRDGKRPGRIGHVGIYVGKDSFIHAVGDEKPVQITPLSRPHYARRFVRGGRIVG